MTFSLSVDLKDINGALREEIYGLLPKARDQWVHLQEKSCPGAEYTGWVNWPEEQGFALVQEIESSLSELKVFYDLVVVIGIGGSYSGTRAVADALSHTYSLALQSRGSSATKPIVYAGHHLSEEGLQDLLELLDTHEPIINVISKSGTTTEPSIAFRVLRNYLQKRYSKREASERILVTTDAKKGILRSLAARENLRSFVVPDDVGGRYSVLTAVGLVPLALAGFHIRDLMNGAAKFFEEMKPKGDDLHPLFLHAACRYTLWNRGIRQDMMAYHEPKLQGFVEWWKQLFGESEGKGEKGLFPVGLLYSTDLHSLGQYLQEGPVTMMETFFYVDHQTKRSSSRAVHKELRIPTLADGDDGLGYLEGRRVEDVNLAAMDAARKAHSDRGVPCVSVRVGAPLDEGQLGYLFAYFQTLCGVSALMLGVNPFDQPGVEAYKVNMFRALGKPGC